jgi:Xaa-Pro aminopeptidase
MNGNNIPQLANLILDIKRDLSGMREGKLRIDSLFIYLMEIIEPKMSFEKLKGICETRLQPYQDVIVHIIPESVPFHSERTDLIVKEGQLITIDCAVKVNREWADGAYTFAVGEIDKSRKYLLSCSKELFQLVKKMSRPNNAFIDTVKKINHILEFSECFLVPGCGGHGIGRNLHQGNEYIYSDFNTNFVYPNNESYTVEPVLGMTIKGENIYSYFEETIVN